MNRTFVKIYTICTILLAFFIFTSAANAQWMFLYNIKGGAGYTGADLNGTWQLSVGDVYGNIVVSNSGSTISGSGNNPEEGPFNITGGRLSLSSSGELTGTLEIEGGETVTFTTGRMNQGKTMIAALVTDSEGDTELIFLMKTGGTTSQLEGTWYFAGGNDDGLLHGTITFDSSGNVTGGGFSNELGESDTFTSGSFTVTNGSITGSITDSTSETSTVSYGFMNSDTNEIIINIGSGTTDTVLLICVKGGGSSFATANLGGDWFIFGASSATGPVNGTVTANSSGSITSGTITISGVDESISGNLSLNTTGVVSGSVTADTDTSDVIAGQMNLSKARFFALLGSSGGTGDTGDTGETGGGGGCFISTAIEK